MNTLLAILFVMFSAPTPPSPKYTVIVTADELYQAYHRDRTHANDLYFNKQLLLRGVVKRATSNMNAVFLVIPGPGDGVIAVIDGNQELTKIPQYKSGDQFELVCIGAGTVLGMPIVLSCKLPN